jgi:hypothetical protein
VLALLVLAPGLGAQAIDPERSRFLTDPNGRPGTCAPYRLSFEAADETTTLEVIHGNTRMSREVATTPGQVTEVVLPVFVADGVTVRAGEAVHQPRLPLRRIEPDYEQPYAAVFSADAVYARPIVPSVPGVMVCDYFENREFFTDWRMLDGYDGIVIFQPEAQRLPSGSQQAIAEFCSLGGAAVIVGSFELGEEAVGMPAPAEPELMHFQGVKVQRFGYGPGAIYRIEFDDLRENRAPHRVLRAVLLDHMWYGQTQAPGGAPPTRVPLPESPLLRAGPPERAQITPLFFGLAGALLLVCALTPLVARRLKGGTWWSPPVVALLAVGLAYGATTQDRPTPAADVWTLAHTDEAGLGWTRTYVLAEADWDIGGEVALDAERWLARPWRSGSGQRGWQIDLPLQTIGTGQVSHLGFGEVDGRRFRDFATAAQRGDTHFDTQTAMLLAWWLDANTYRGRFAAMGPGEWNPPEDRFEGTALRNRGVLWVSNQRKDS